MMEVWEDQIHPDLFEGDDAHGRDAVILDLWESYLEAT